MYKFTSIKKEDYNLPNKGIELYLHKILVKAEYNPTEFVFGKYKGMVGITTVNGSKYCSCFIMDTTKPKNYCEGYMNYFMIESCIDSKISGGHYSDPYQRADYFRGLLYGWVNPNAPFSYG